MFALLGRNIVRSIKERHILAWKKVEKTLEGTLFVFCWWSCQQRNEQASKTLKAAPNALESYQKE